MIVTDFSLRADAAPNSTELRAYACHGTKVGQQVRLPVLLMSVLIALILFWVVLTSQVDAAEDS